jgi:hypothetical protein
VAVDEEDSEVLAGLMVVVVFHPVAATVEEVSGVEVEVMPRISGGVY